MRISLLRRLVPAIAVAAVGLYAAVAIASAAPSASILYVNGGLTLTSIKHQPRSSNPCASTSFTTIGAAVSAAGAGSWIFVCPGVYDEGVVLDKQITLIGEPGAVIDAATSATGNGIQILGPGGSGSLVSGFTIENARFEGILVGTAPVAPATTDGTAVTSGAGVSNVTIEGNTLVGNDTAFGSTAGQCFSTPEAPGDCGEALHLVSVTNSLIEGNTIHNNAGGILLTDEFGATSGNTIANNVSENNPDDCGITLAGHNPAAVNPKTGMPTGAAGVFDNVVEGNIASGNGVAGQGAGILLGGGAPFAGVYGNTISGNLATGNGLSGITIHQHFAGDLNGNVLTDNTLSNDNLDGDMDFAAAADTQTTGILVAAGLPPGPPNLLPPGPTIPPGITGTVISGNTFSDVAVGIWTLNVDPATTTISGNVFGAGVTTPVSSH